MEKCPYCAKLTLTKSGMEAHVRREHADKLKISIPRKSDVMQGVNKMAEENKAVSIVEEKKEEHKYRIIMDITTSDLRLHAALINWIEGAVKSKVNVLALDCVKNRSTNMQSSEANGVESPQQFY